MWRNVVKFDPLQPLQGESARGYTYEEILLRPAAEALNDVARADTQVGDAWVIAGRFGAHRLVCVSVFVGCLAPQRRRPPSSKSTRTRTRTRIASINNQVEFTLTGEQGLSVFTYPKSWAALLDRVKATSAK
jgi:hypothetical protein